jgi:hypothetical protein
MNRSFKTEFHNGNTDQKPIVTMQVRVDNGTKFKELDTDGLKNLYHQLNIFKEQVEAFGNEIFSLYLDKTPTIKP